MSPTKKMLLFAAALVLGTLIIHGDKYRSGSDGTIFGPSPYEKPPEPQSDLVKSLIEMN